MNKNLPNLVRPKSLDDFICNDELKLIFENIIKNDDFHSFIFYGKPGTGKTTISFILAEGLKASYDYFNAAIDNKENLTRKINLNKILIIDEIHRLNKDKQDILLPYLENDMITIYATTTENPYFKLNPALRSRCLIIEIQKPSTENLALQLKKINKQFNFNLDISDETYNFLALQSGGDFRAAINNLDLLSILSKNKKISLDNVKKIIPQIQFSADKNQDSHYDYLSAFHKSLRGSDPNASLYYGFIIVKSGDFDGLFRRMICVAYEDIGLANPLMGPNILNAIAAFERIGMPEGYLPISYAILSLALSPKSNSSSLAGSKSLNVINSGKIFEVPNFLRDSHYKSSAKLNHGIGYKYPHDYENHYVKQDYLPKELKNEEFYKNQLQGYEEKIKLYWSKIKNGE
ncbi:replication-associated recombination protein A [Metamycoplasma buccale]|uniref:replication-associated recombination protein A n=1 Tax=Metamycoplasma buccale TaxID=55602 RepID=UPI00398E4132